MKNGKHWIDRKQLHQFSPRNFMRRVKISENTESSRDVENDRRDIDNVTKTEGLDRHYVNESFDPAEITVIHASHAGNLFLGTTLECQLVVTNLSPTAQLLPQNVERQQRKI